MLIDFIDLQYHETVGNAGGDLASKFLADQMLNEGTEAFVMVVEGAVQDKADGGAWAATGSSALVLHRRGREDVGVHALELSFDDVVFDIGTKGDCKAIVAIGQCATFGGYPACTSPAFGGARPVRWASTTSSCRRVPAAANKVINVPGCPTNPWWFVLSVVAWLVDATAVPRRWHRPAADPQGRRPGSIKTTSVDSTRRLKAVYGTPLHGPYCTRYQDFLNMVFARYPGDAGLLAAHRLQGTLDYDAMWTTRLEQPAAARTPHLSSRVFRNFKAPRAATASPVATPCMACTEKGYPGHLRAVRCPLADRKEGRHKWQSRESTRSHESKVTWAPVHDGRE